jgi:hypothetical protein
MGWNFQISKINIYQKQEKNLRTLRSRYLHAYRNPPNFPSRNTKNLYDSNINEPAFLADHHQFSQCPLFHLQRVQRPRSFPRFYLVFYTSNPIILNHRLNHLRNETKFSPSHEMFFTRREKLTESQNSNHSYLQR